MPAAAMSTQVSKISLRLSGAVRILETADNSTANISPNLIPGGHLYYTDISKDRLASRPHTVRRLYAVYLAECITSAACIRVMQPLLRSSASRPLSVRSRSKCFGLNQDIVEIGKPGISKDGSCMCG